MWARSVVELNQSRGRSLIRSTTRTCPTTSDRSQPNVESTLAREIGVVKKTVPIKWLAKENVRLARLRNLGNKVPLVEFRTEGVSPPPPCPPVFLLRDCSTSMP